MSLRGLVFGIFSALVLFGARGLRGEDSTIIQVDANGKTQSAIVLGSPLIHTSQIVGTDPSQILDQIEKIVVDCRGDKSTIARLHLIGVNHESMDRLKSELRTRFPKRSPTITCVIGNLSQPGATMAVDAVASVRSHHSLPSSRTANRVERKPAASVLLPGPRVYISGQAEKGDSPSDAARKTMEGLVRTLDWLGGSLDDVVQIKSFLQPILSAKEIEAELTKFFGSKPAPPMVFVEWSSDAPIEIELIAAARTSIRLDSPRIEFLTPPWMKPSPVYSKVVRIQSPETIFYNGLFSQEPGNGTAEVSDVFEQLTQFASTVGGDLKHLAKATYYVSGADSSAQLNMLRPKYYDPTRAPAASKAMVAGVGERSRTLTMDMIGIFADQPWRVGLADSIITPQSSIWMAGFAARTRPSEGVLNELHAKAVAIADSHGSTCVLITTDLIAFPRSLRDEVAQSVQERFGIPSTHVMLNCSHTHGGPVVVDDFEKSILYALAPDQDRVVQQYYTQLRENLKDVAARAIENLSPSKLGFSEARCGFAMNRRLPSPSGYRNSPNPSGPVDHSVPVLRLDNPNGSLRGVLFGYACHNTSMVSDNYLITSDYAGFSQEAFETAHPGSKALFVMGCGGDQNAYPRGNVEVTRIHGKTLATAVDAALLPTAEPIVGKLRVALKDVDLPFRTLSKEKLLVDRESNDPYAARRSQHLLRELETKGKLRESYPFPVQVIRLGDSLTLVALGGETVVDYALRIKKELGAKVWVAGYSNDVFAYIPSKRVLEEGGYEGGEAMKYSLHPGTFTEDIEQRIMATVHELVTSTSNKP